MTIKAVQIKTIQDGAVKNPYLDCVTGIIHWDVEKTLEAINCEWLWDKIESRYVKLFFETNYLYFEEFEKLEFADTFKMHFKCVFSGFIFGSDVENVGHDKHSIVDPNPTDWIIFDDQKNELIVKRKNSDDGDCDLFRLYTDVEYQEMLLSEAVSKDLVVICGLNEQGKVDLLERLQSMTDDIGLEINSTPLCEKHPYILECFADIAQGSFDYDHKLQLTFTPKGSDKSLRVMPNALMDVRHSHIKVLHDIWLDLTRLRAKGVLFLNNPEQHLHPENQMKLTKLLTYLVNLGVKVRIATNSDFIVNELNNLIRLSVGTKHANEVRKEYDYKKSELLNSDRVVAYDLDAYGNASIANIYKEYGIEIKTIDKAIDRMNNIGRDLRYGG